MRILQGSSNAAAPKLLDTLEAVQQKTLPKNFSQGKNKRKDTSFQKKNFQESCIYKDYGNLSNIFNTCRRKTRETYRRLWRFSGKCNAVLQDFNRYTGNGCSMISLPKSIADAVAAFGYKSYQTVHENITYRLDAEK